MYVYRFTKTPIKIENCHGELLIFEKEEKKSQDFFYNEIKFKDTR